MSLKDFTQAGNFQAPEIGCSRFQFEMPLLHQQAVYMWLESVGADHEMPVNVAAGFADKPC